MIPIVSKKQTEKRKVKMSEEIDVIEILEESNNDDNESTMEESVASKAPPKGKRCYSNPTKVSYEDTNCKQQ